MDPAHFWASTRSAPEGAEESIARRRTEDLSELRRGRPPKGPKRSRIAASRQIPQAVNAVGPRRGRREEGPARRPSAPEASTRSAPEGAEELAPGDLRGDGVRQLQRGRPPKGPKRLRSRRSKHWACASTRSAPEGAEEMFVELDPPAAELSTRSAPEGAESNPRGEGSAHASTRSAPEGAEERPPLRPRHRQPDRFNAVGPRRGRRGRADPGVLDRSWLQRGRPPKGPKRIARAPDAQSPRAWLQRGRPPKGPKSPPWRHREPYRNSLTIARTPCRRGRGHLHLFCSQAASPSPRPSCSPEYGGSHARSGENDRGGCVRFFFGRARGDLRNRDPLYLHTPCHRTHPP